MADFEWDEGKNRRNRAKHGMDLSDAESIFDDDHSLEFNASKNGEFRIVRIGKAATKVILFVVYTMRGLVVRLISARQASKNERNLYLVRKLKDQDDADANR